MTVSTGKTRFDFVDGSSYVAVSAIRDESGKVLALLNPDLPSDMFHLSDERLDVVRKEWGCFPFIESSVNSLGETVFTIWCLDGGAWDRPTWWGCGESLPEARDILISRIER